MPDDHAIRSRTNKGLCDQDVDAGAAVAASSQDYILVSGCISAAFDDSTTSTQPSMAADFVEALPAGHGQPVFLSHQLAVQLVTRRVVVHAYAHTLSLERAAGLHGNPQRHQA